MLSKTDALVTAASSGTGRAIALICAVEGVKIVVLHINAEEGEETAKLARSQGVKQSLPPPPVLSVLAHEINTPT